MKIERVGFSRTKIWLAFAALFVCGTFVGVGIANWGHAIAKTNSGDVSANGNADNLTACQAIENVLLGRLRNNDSDCDDVKRDVDNLKKLATYGCDENREKYIHEIDNKNAVLDVACDNWFFNNEETTLKPCEQIEANLQERLGHNDVSMGAEKRIDRAKIYAIMAERGCPENTQKYTDLARKELEIARGISDDKLDEEEALEAVETYKRLKMQQDAEEVFNKVKKLTNPAIDFIMQVEKVINE